MYLGIETPLHNKPCITLSKTVCRGHATMKINLVINYTALSADVMFVMCVGVYKHNIITHYNHPTRK